MIMGLLKWIFGTSFETKPADRQLEELKKTLEGARFDWLVDSSIPVRDRLNRFQTTVITGNPVPPVVHMTMFLAHIDAELANNNKESEMKSFLATLITILACIGLYDYLCWLEHLWKNK
jgi:hypothetical protein